MILTTTVALVLSKCSCLPLWAELKTDHNVTVDCLTIAKFLLPLQSFDDSLGHHHI